MKKILLLAVILFNSVELIQAATFRFALSDDKSIEFELDVSNQEETIGSLKQRVLGKFYLVMFDESINPGWNPFTMINNAVMESYGAYDLVRSKIKNGEYDPDLCDLCLESGLTLDNNDATLQDYDGCNFNVVIMTFVDRS